MAKKKTAILSLENGEKAIINYGRKEESLWEKVAKAYYDSGFKVPNKLKIVSEDGEHEALVVIDVDDGPNRKEDRVTINLIYDSFELEKSLYKPKRLRHIDAEKDIRHRYDMNPNSMGPRTLSIGAIAGIIGKKGYDRLENGMVYSPFASQLYWLRYYEKLKAGYKDYTKYLAEEKDENQVEKFFMGPSEDEQEISFAQELFKFFAESSKDTLRASGIELDFYSNTSPYTRRQTGSARKIYNKMCTAKTPTEMNTLMDDLIAIASPKYEKGTTVSSFYVKEVKDPEEQRELMAKKLEWVNSLVSSMEAVVAFQQNDSKVKEYKSPFGDVIVQKETEEEMEETKKIMNPRQASKVVAIYRVTPTEQLKRYEKKLSELYKVEEHRLFHGSPNCNWISIIQNGLLLNPNAQICGKAYGNGTYFAPDSDKSAGYGSQSGSYWRGGTEAIAAMGIYRVATGNTYEPSGLIGGDPEKTKELLEMFKKKKYDSLWYHAGNGPFVRDEVVVYDEAQSCLEKIVLYAA